MTTITPTRIAQDAKDALRVLFIAKHARWKGDLHPTDGNHALYHQEMREVLEVIGLNLLVEDRYEALFETPAADFVFPLLNRGGFFNSEMLVPLLCTRWGVPFLGASPILRGLSDDKDLTKQSAKARNIPTAPWAVFRRGAPVDPARCPPAARWVVKPNNSSASWGVGDAHDHAGLAEAILAIHDDGQDAIVEPFLTGSDVEVPVILSDGVPTVMPMMLFEQADPSHLRTYAEKRDLVDRSEKYSLVPFDEPMLTRRIRAMTEQLVQVFHPFDYGRFEFRVDLTTGEIHFLEVNLNCNLWSRKVFGRSALLAGMTQADLIETIFAESLIRQGLARRCNAQLATSRRKGAANG